MSLIRLLSITILLFSQVSYADKYVIDTQGGHAFIQFKITHLGFSYVLGDFERFAGEFNFDPKQPNKSNVTLDIHIASLNTNHSERDKHLKEWDYFASGKFPRAYFRSTKVDLIKQASGKLSGTVQGQLKIKGRKRLIELQVNEVGRGKDPWGGERIGFEARTKLMVSDYGINFYQTAEPAQVEVYAVIEGIKR